MSHASPDRNLLFGLLALKMDLIDRRQLVRAFDDWLADKARPLGQILVDEGVLQSDERDDLSRLMERFLARHNGDAQKSLAAISSIGPARAELESLADPALNASLLHVAAAPETAPEDPDKTVTLGAPSAAGTRFRILRSHAKGGLGEVYLADDTELHRQVALKQIQDRHADHPDSRARFLLEAEITGGLEHPGIVPVYGLGTYADGRPFYAMRFIQGDSLKQAVDDFHGSAERGTRNAERQTGEHKHSALRVPSSAFETLAFRQLLQRFIDVCNAVAYAHSRGVLHRDLKPGNIMLGKYGETLVVDWGLAKCSHHAPRDENRAQLDESLLHPTSASTSAPTQMGAAIGTPAYMSPEQASGRLDQLGPASDVYSLGATLYYLLTGEAPFSKQDVDATLRKVQAGDFAPPRQLNAAVPKPLEAVCLKAMSLRASDRFASPRELADELERYLADEALACHLESLAKRVRRWGRRHRAVVAAAATSGAVLLIALAAGLALATRHNSQLLAEQQKTQSANAELASANNRLRDSNEQERLAKLDEAQARQRAEGVTDYLVKTFRSPDPGRDGRTVTMAEVLDRSVQDLNDQFHDQPQTKASLLNAIGESYLGLGLYHEAIPVFEQARDLRRAKLGAEHADTLASTNDLAAAYQDAGKLDLALPLYEQTLALRRDKQGLEHPDTLHSMQNLAAAYHSAGKLDLALPLCEQTLALRRDKLGAEHPETLQSMNNLAVAYQFAGKLDLALPLYEETLVLRRARLGPEHPETLKSVNNLAGAYNSAGKLDLALPLWKDTLAATRAKLGAEHPDTLRAMNNLAEAYQSAGKLELALPLLEETLSLRRAKLGADHPDTLTSMNNLAFAYQSARKLELALPLLEETLAVRRAKLGAEHPDTLMSMNNLAFVYQSAGKQDLALPLLEETLALRRAKLGAEHPDTLMSMNNLAFAYQFKGKLDLALPLYEETLALKRTKLGSDHPGTLVSISNLAFAYLPAKRFEESLALLDTYLAAQRVRLATNQVGLAGILASVSLELLKHGQFVPAETYLRECLAIRQEDLPDEWSLFNTKSLLGAALAGQKKFDEAEPLLVEGYEGMKAREDTVPAASKTRLTEALQRLVDLYTAWDKPEEAAKWREKLPPKP